MCLLLLLARFPGLSANQLTARLHPERLHAARGWIAVYLTRLRQLGLIRIACVPRSVYSLTADGYALCRRFRDNEYPAAGTYIFPP